MSFQGPHAGPDPDNPESTLLVKSALRGVAWNWTGSGMLVVAQIASTAATARLVSPDEFGVYAAAQAASGLAGYFCMGAVGPGLQRRPQLGPKTIGTAMSITLACSFVTALCMWLGASLWSHAWGLPEAAWAVRIFAVALFLQCAAVVPLAVIRRHLNFGRAALIETVAIIGGMLVGVVIATQLHSAEALAFGQMAGGAVMLAAAVVMVDDRIVPTFDRADGRELFSFAGQVGGFWFSSYFTNALPSWFVARMFGGSALGLYSRARLMAELPAEYAATGVAKVIFPLYGRVREDSARVRTLLGEALTLTTGFLWPVFAFLAGASPLLIDVVLGARWDGAASLLALCAFGACAVIPAGLLTNCAEALGWMRVMAIQQIALLGGVAAAGLLVYVADCGANALLLCVAGAQWLAYCVALSRFVHRKMLSLSEVLKDQAVHAVFALMAFGVALACIQIANDAPLTLRLVSLSIGTLVVAGGLVLCWPWFPAGRIFNRRVGQVAPTWRGLRFLR